MTELERYREELKKEWTTNSKMINYCFNKAEEVIELQNKVVVIEKEKIKTTFCFGYGSYGISTDEEEEKAYNLMKAYESDQKYFIEENTEDLRRAIKQLEEYNIFIAPYYRDSEIYYWSNLYAYENLEDKGIPNALLLDDEEKQKLIAAYKRALEKRINKAEYMDIFGRLRVFKRFQGPRRFLEHFKRF